MEPSILMLSISKFGRKSLVLLWLFLLCSCVGEERRGPIDRSDLAVEIKHIRGGVYLAQDFSYWRANFVFYLSDEGVYFFDSGYSPKISKQVLWKASTMTFKDFHGVILTSHHIERSGGLEAFYLEGVKMIARPRTIELLNQNWEFQQREMARTFGSFKISEKIRVEEALKKTKLLDGAIEFKELPQSDFLAVYFPKEKVLYAGSLLGDPPLFLDRFDRADYAASIKELKEWNPEIVISGSGKPIGDASILDISLRSVNQFLNSRLESSPCSNQAGKYRPIASLE